jgi:hypothetical protein
MLLVCAFHGVMNEPTHPRSLVYEQWYHWYRPRSGPTEGLPRIKAQVRLLYYCNALLTFLAFRVKAVSRSHYRGQQHFAGVRTALFL